MQLFTSYQFYCFWLRSSESSNFSGRIRSWWFSVGSLKMPCFSCHDRAVDGSVWRRTFLKPHGVKANMWLAVRFKHFLCSSVDIESSLQPTYLQLVMLGVWPDAASSNLNLLKPLSFQRLRIPRYHTREFRERKSFAARSSSSLSDSRS